MNSMNTLMTNFECPPTPASEPQFRFEVCDQVMTEKDKEINELKRLISKLQEPKPDHKEECITELTHIIEDILIMYPNNIINQAQTIEELYKSRMQLFIIYLTPLRMRQIR